LYETAHRGGCGEDGGCNGRHQRAGPEHRLHGSDVGAGCGCPDGCGLRRGQTVGHREGRGDGDAAGVYEGE